MASRTDRPQIAGAGEREAAHDLWQNRCGGPARPHARPFVPARSEKPRMTRPQAATQPKEEDNLSDSEFKALLADVIPHLRAYGRSLCGNPDLADDLTQDTLVRAWASRDRFERGTSLNA